MDENTRFVTDKNGKRIGAFIGIDAYRAFKRYIEKLEDEEDEKAVKQFIKDHNAGKNKYLKIDFEKNKTRPVNLNFGVDW